MAIFHLQPSTCERLLEHFTPADAVFILCWFRNPCAIKDYFDVDICLLQLCVCITPSLLAQLVLACLEHLFTTFANTFFAKDH